MNVRYFEKRGQVWLDFKDATGARRRVPTGCTTRASAEKEAAAVIAKALSVPSGPASSTVAQGAKGVASGPTLELPTRKALRTREQRLHLGLVQRQPPDGLGARGKTRRRISTRDEASHHRLRQHQLVRNSCHTVCGKVALTSPEEQRRMKRCA